MCDKVGQINGSRSKHRGNEYVKSEPTRFHQNLRCDDCNPQTANNICDSGTCVGCPVDNCTIAAGTFDPLTQQCSPPTTKANGTTCDSETTMFIWCDTQTPNTMSRIYESIDVDSSSIA